jgi:chromosome segregation ATPase
MTTDPQGSDDQRSGQFGRSERGASGPSVNPRLSANLRADYDALQNDMQQAKELAADFQRQLAGKSNEFAQLKQIFEKTQTDLASLQAGIVELRAERHDLANEAMRSTAFQMKLKKITEERDRLRMDLEIVREALAQTADEVAAARRERNSEVAALVIDLVKTKEALADALRQLEIANRAPTPVICEANLPAAGEIDPSKLDEESIEIMRNN